MRITNLLWLSAPILFAAGCASPTYNDHYMSSRNDVVVPSATSARPVTRVYPDTSTTVTTRTYEAAPAKSPVPADEWETGMRVRNLIAGDAYLKGAARNVDVEVIRGQAILRGTVLSDYDRQELAARIGQVPGITAVDNRLVVSTP